jgi:hypothetical protein
MAPPSPAELRRLLEFPTETLSLEHKGWLDLSETRARATLAKAAIALANHGGGIIVLGMRESYSGPLQSRPRPDALKRCTPDEINSSINKYADPEIHCELSFAVHPESGVEHAFVSVPSDTTVPIMSKAGCDGVIVARRCYIRKPGPRSEEPFEAHEWRALLDRCVRAGRESMLESIRAIVQGRAGGVAEPAVGDALTVFTEATRSRWFELVVLLPADDPARFPHGRYELGFEIITNKPMPNLAELRRAMQQASVVKHTGWGPFAQLTRSEYEPRIVGGVIEAWLGLPAERVLGRDPAHCDFWRADSAGRLFLMRGYDEDGALGGREPGRWTDVTLPVWRVGEAILYIGRLAEFFGEDLSFLVRCRFSGLRGRMLTSIDGRRVFLDVHRCSDDEVILERQITLAQARDNLVEVLLGLLSPLYERFSFFELSEKLVAEEVEKMTRNRF